MNMGFGVVGAAVGGVIGAAAWAAISHFFQYELGWIASITGALAGLGFKLGFPRGGVTAGVLAAVIGVASIGVGKVAALVMDIQNAPSRYDVNDDREFLVSYFVDEVVEERRLAGESVDWPGGRRDPEADERRDYNPEVWKEGEARWDALSPGEQERFARDPVAPIVDEVVISTLADEVAEEWALEGRAVEWPVGAVPFQEYRRSWYPGDVWSEAEGRWAALPENMKQARRMEYSTAPPSFAGSVRLAIDVLPQTFSAFDLLWVALGVGAAYKIAAGDGDEAVLV